MQLDAVRDASEYCDQNVFIYIAEANGARNEEMRRLRMPYIEFLKFRYKKRAIERICTCSFKSSI